MEGGAGQHAVPHRRALPVRWLMAKADSEAKVWDYMANMIEQFIRNGLQPLGSLGIMLRGSHPGLGGKPRAGAWGVGAEAGAACCDIGGRQLLDLGD